MAILANLEELPQYPIRLITKLLYTLIGLLSHGIDPLKATLLPRLAAITAKICSFSNSTHPSSSHLDRQPECKDGTHHIPFIDHQPSEISETLPTVSWSFTPSADLLTGGISTSQLRESHL